MTVLFITKKFEPVLNMTVYYYQLGGDTINVRDGWNLIDGNNSRNGEISYLYVSEE